MGDAYLLLENGMVFKGRQFGFDGEASGELVYSTAMSGYMETLANPVYAGKIVMETFPLIGCYGVVREEFGAGPVYMSAYIVREWCREPSNFRSEGTLDDFLRGHGTPGLCGIDTRALMRVLRERGPMRATISRDLP